MQYFIFIGPDFPKELCNYGLSEEVLAASFHAVQMGGKPKWYLRGIPNFAFYKSLHPFLKHWHVTESATKVAIGTFYIEIDVNMKQKGGRPDNIYRFVDKAVKASRSSDDLMSYTFQQTEDQFQKELKELQTNFTNCTDQVKRLNSDMLQLKQQLEASRQDLQVSRCALRDVTNEKKMIEKQNVALRKKCAKSKKVQFCLEEEIANLHLENVDLSMDLAELEKDLCDGGSGADVASEENFTFQTKNGKQYSPGIRKLYYTLLTNQVPAMKVSEIVKSVVKCFNPSIDVEHLQLPQHSCASYMRREELHTICTAHSATTLCDNSIKSLHLNTDGTTKCQKKLGALAINGITISVNELTDGSASTAIADVSKELEKLRNTAHILGLPNPDSINWTIIATSTSDSAATQKHFNVLVEKCRMEDEAKFGTPQMEAFELLENFCSMHLGINLRKAFVSGLKYADTVVSQDRDRQQHPIDVLVYEFCKAFGQHGVPEYGCGRSFSDFLNLMSKQADTAELCTYYQQCCVVRLERQIGNRYFVTAANAAKILFLRCAALEFLRYSDKGFSGNMLEQSVYEKLISPIEVVFLKADSLMFYHVYANIVTLSKSTILNKSAMDMNQHYFELVSFLEEAENHPEMLLNRNHEVFPSERRLYGNLKETNCRLSQGSDCILNCLFSINTDIDSTLLKILPAAVQKMCEKLKCYAQNQLPGGVYWDPEPTVRLELSKLKPTNDLCESILGLNDYLTTALPNLHQLTRSTLVRAKKNKTITWLDSLPDREQGEVIDLAVRSRRNVKKSLKEEEERQLLKRQHILIENHTKREAARRKLMLEKEKLFDTQLITSSQELQCYLSEIDSIQEISATKKKAKKLLFLKEQIKFRKKVLGQPIHITFSHCGRQKSIDSIVQELADFIDLNPYEYAEYLQDPSSLVGKRVTHRFELPNYSMKWYEGTVLQFDKDTQQHTLVYEDDDEQYTFNLVIDLLSGDLKVF